MELEIRAARPGEEVAILPLYEWLLAPPGTRPDTWDEARAERALAAAIRGSGAVVLLALAGGGPVGFCTAYADLHSVRFGPRVWVEDLAVDPEQRSRGVGAALLRAAQAWARERGATHLELDSGDARADAQRFYERERPDWRSRSYAWRL